MYFKSLLILITFLTSSVISAQGEFKFDDLVYQIYGKDYESNKVNQYENINVLIKGISGCIRVDGYAQLGMEVVITDNNSNRLLYTPDMLSDSKLDEEDLKKVKFNIDLTQDYIRGEEYFIKIKVWDKVTKKSFSKHSSFIITDPLRNNNTYVDVRRLKLAGYKIYLDGDRVFNANTVREGDEIVVELLLNEFDFEQNEDIVVVSKVIDEQNSKVYSLEKDFVIVDKSDDLMSVLVKTEVDIEHLISGKTYIFHLQFHNASRNQKLDMKFTFLYLSSNYKVNSVKLSGIKTQLIHNQEEVKGTPIVEIGDRIDVVFEEWQSKLMNDFGFYKIGGIVKVYNAKGELLRTSQDQYRDFGIFPSGRENAINFNFFVPFDFIPNMKYILEVIVWDKYSLNFFTKKVPIKMAKFKVLPYGLEENPNFHLKYIEGKVEPISIYVLRNDYKEFSNELRVLDRISVVIACKLSGDVEFDDLMRIVQLYDKDNNLLSLDEEEMYGFTGGELFANIVIPEFGVEYGEIYKLITILEGSEEELLKVEYQFTVRK